VISSSHVFYIPLILLAGMVLGAFFGRRWAMLRCDDEMELLKRKLERERAAMQDEASASARGAVEEGA